MGRHRNNPQMKEMKEYPEKELSKIEASNFSDIEFKIIVIKILNELSENYKELNGNYQEMNGYIRMKKDINL